MKVILKMEKKTGKELCIEYRNGVIERKRIIYFSNGKIYKGDFINNKLKVKEYIILMVTNMKVILKMDQKI